jgi:hypothetical protein
MFFCIPFSLMLVEGGGGKRKNLERGEREKDGVGAGDDDEAGEGIVGEQGENLMKWTLILFFIS